MRVGLISGHGAGDPGASGCGYSEADLTIEVVKQLDKRFAELGIATSVYPYNRNAYKDCKNDGLAVDFSDCNFVLEVHFNACVNDECGNGKVTGSEIWITPREATHNTEDKILNNLAEIGFTNRGVKSKDFLVINKVKNQGVSSALIEVCFIDDFDDMTLFVVNQTEVIEAVVKGVCDGYGVKYVEPAVSVMSQEAAENYIRTDCVEFLNRQATVNELEKYVPALMSGEMTEADVDNAFKGCDEYNVPYESPYYKLGYVVKCCYLILGRFPGSEEEIKSWLSLPRLRDIHDVIYNSEEAANRRAANK